MNPAIFPLLGRVAVAATTALSSVMAYFMVTDVTDAVDNVTIPAMSGLVQDKPDNPPSATERFGQVFGIGFAVVLLVIIYNVIKGFVKGLKF